MTTLLRLIFPLLLCLSACAIVETEHEREEFRIVEGNIEKATYQAEIAADSGSRRRGLMYRKSMDPEHGMLLDYKRPTNMAIWMKNTYISLDILFINEKGVIVKIHEAAEPLSTTSIKSETEVRAVLEVNAGQVSLHKIRVGDQVRHPSFKN
jgi:uncharacterized protein